MSCQMWKPTENAISGGKIQKGVSGSSSNSFYEHKKLSDLTCHFPTDDVMRIVMHLGIAIHK